MADEEAKVEVSACPDGGVLPTDGTGDTAAPDRVEASQVRAEYHKLVCEDCLGRGEVLCDIAYTFGSEEWILCDTCSGTGHPPTLGHPAAREIANLRNRIKELEDAQTTT